MRLRLKFALLACGAVALTVPASAQQAQPAPLARADAYAQVTKWPDWSGVWSPGVGTGSRTTATPPKLTPEAQRISDAFEAGKARGENLQNPAANCIPNGMPGIMRLPYPIEFIYSPGRVNIVILVRPVRSTEFIVLRITQEGGISQSGAAAAEE